MQAPRELTRRTIVDARTLTHAAARLRIDDAGPSIGTHDSLTLISRPREEATADVTAGVGVDAVIVAKVEFAAIALPSGFAATSTSGRPRRRDPVTAVHTNRFKAKVGRAVAEAGREVAHTGLEDDIAVYIGGAEHLRREGRQRTDRIALLGDRVELGRPVTRTDTIVACVPLRRRGAPELAGATSVLTRRQTAWWSGRRDQTIDLSANHTKGRVAPSLCAGMIVDDPRCRVRKGRVVADTVLAARMRVGTAILNTAGTGDDAVR